MDDAEIEAAEEQYIEESPLTLSSTSDDLSSRSSGALKSQGHVSIAEATKYPLANLEASLGELARVLQGDLNRLYRHTVNLTRTSNEGDWQGLHQEETKTAATVTQVSAVIRELTKTRRVVTSEDLPTFEEQARSLLEDTLSTMDEVLPVIYVDVQRDFRCHHLFDPVPEEPSSGGGGGGGGVAGDSGTADTGQDTTSTTTGPTNVRHRKQRHTYVNPQYPESSVRLQESVQELSDIIHTFFLDMKHHDDVPTPDTGPTTSLSLTSLLNRAKNAFLPVVGAMVGGVMAGPVGVAAGVIGGAVGFAGGRYVQNHRHPHDLSEILKNKDAFLSSQPCPQCQQIDQESPQCSSSPEKAVMDSEMAENPTTGAAQPETDTHPDPNTAQNTENLERKDEEELPSNSQKHSEAKHERESQSKSADAGVTLGRPSEADRDAVTEDKTGDEDDSTETSKDETASSTRPARPDRERTSSVSEDITKDISEVVNAMTGPIQKLFHFDKQA